MNMSSAPGTPGDVSLLRRLLGNDLDRLPAGLREFHDAPDRGRVVGRFRVLRPRGLRRWLGDRLGFPPPGEDVPLELVVERDGDRDRWVRRFGDQVLCTTQEVRGTRLVERLGPWRLEYALRVEEPDLRYELRAARLLGLPLPGFLRPRDQTVEHGLEDGWEVRVRVALPLLGTLLEYGGRLTREPA